MQHTDPVCGMKVDPSTPWRSAQGDRTVYFCSESCKQKFDASPSRYESTGEDS